MVVLAASEHSALLSAVQCLEDGGEAPSNFSNSTFVHYSPTQNLSLLLQNHWVHIIRMALRSRLPVRHNCISHITTIHSYLQGKDLVFEISHLRALHVDWGLGLASGQKLVTAQTIYIIVYVIICIIICTYLDKFDIDNKYIHIMVFLQMVAQIFWCNNICQHITSVAHALVL